MSTSKIEQPTLFYTPPFLKDVAKTEPSISLGTFNQYRKEAEFQREDIRTLFVETNFQSKEHLYKYGKVCFFEKPPLRRYDWQVIKATAESLRILLATNIKTAIFLLVLVPVTFKIGTWAGDAHIFATFLFIIVPAIQKAQQPYLDRFGAYRSVSQLPNSMQGFDLNELANEESEEKDGWADPITLDTIPRDQISSTHILRIGHYAIPIVNALQSILTRSYQRNDCDVGEIPHPLEVRQLNPEEKEKFLREVSTFFAISDSKKLQACWNIKLADMDAHSYIPQIRNWNSFPPNYQAAVLDDLAKQLLQVQRKKTFFSLLNLIIAEKYFDDDFRSLKIRIPRVLNVPEDREPTLDELVQMARDQGISEEIIQRALQIALEGNRAEG